MSNTQRFNSCESTTSYTDDWSSINWYKIEKHVDKLQKRIYHAESTGDTRKVRNLQRILLHSDSALLLAIKKVTQTNKGRKTAGIDGFRALTDRKRMKLYYELKSRNIKFHRPKPAFRKYIAKKNGKLRPLSIPIIIDRIYQEIVRMALEPQWEFRFEPISYGFRPKRGVHDAVARIFNNISRGKWCWVFEGDFKSCFDTLSHEFILEQLEGCPLIKLVKRFLEAGYVDDGVFHISQRGTPQGGILSPLLANIALTGLEEYFGISYHSHTREHYGEKYTTFITKGNYRVVRYADDFVIFASNRSDIERVYDILDPYLDERGLTLAEDKTRITHISDGFDFLGFNFRQYDTQRGKKCFIKPSKASIKSYKSKVDDIFKQYYGLSVDDLINRLNPLIRGTANYWCHVVSKKVFSDMHYYMWEKVYKFLRRMHPKKSWDWIKNKYFPYYDDGVHKGNWILTGSKEKNHLIRMDWFKIRRHAMIKHNYSPYDKSKESYFENRRYNRTFG